MAPVLDLTKPGDIWLSYTFHYRPDIYGNSIQIALFSVATIIIAGLNFMFWRRTGNSAKYMHMVTVTGLMEVVGYGLRIHASQNINLTSFIITTVLLLIAPILLAAVNYVVVGKLLKATGKSILFIRPSHATCLFLTADILCFLVQSSAAALLTSKDPAVQDQGIGVVLFGLALQTFFFTCFVFIAVYMAFSKKFALMANPGLRGVFVGLFLTMACLYIRNTFRFVEFASGKNSDVVKYELVFFLFETLPILASFVVYCSYHFGRLLPADAELPGLLLKGTEPEKQMAATEMQQLDV
jgi:hypothetical protein